MLAIETTPVSLFIIIVSVQSFTLASIQAKSPFVLANPSHSTTVNTGLFNSVRLVTVPAAAERRTLTDFRVTLRQPPAASNDSRIVRCGQHIIKLVFSHLSKVASWSYHPLAHARLRHSGVVALCHFRMMTNAAWFVYG